MSLLRRHGWLCVLLVGVLASASCGSSDGDDAAVSVQGSSDTADEVDAAPEEDQDAEADSGAVEDSVPPAPSTTASPPPPPRSFASTSLEVTTTRGFELSLTASAKRPFAAKDISQSDPGEAQLDWGVDWTLGWTNHSDRNLNFSHQVYPVILWPEDAVPGGCVASPAKYIQLVAEGGSTLYCGLEAKYSILPDGTPPGESAEFAGAGYAETRYNFDEGLIDRLVDVVSDPPILALHFSGNPGDFMCFMEEDDLFDGVTLLVLRGSIDSSSPACTA